jgi:hypothetical protein
MTGKAKTDFEIYFRKKYPLNSFRLGTWILGIADFYNLPPAMQYGVYLEFFAENKIYILVYHMKLMGEGRFSWIIEGSDGCNLVKEKSFDGYLTQEETYNISIQKAIEIYNKP